MKISVLVLLILFSHVLLDIANAASAPAPGVEGSICGGKCYNRCSRNWMNKMCIKLCMICCGKCNCVPSSPIASKDECPCYRDMKNRKGQPKCP